MPAPFSLRLGAAKSSKQLVLEYDPTLLPDGQSQCLRCASALSKTYGKEPAGAAFHQLALRQAGLISEEPYSWYTETLHCMT